MTLPAKKKEIKTQSSPAKGGVDSFWDSQGPILEHYQERGTTINSVHYSEGSGASVACQSTKNIFLRAYKRL
jgi:hypothetical protein